jgi:exodeoxyribonuclease VII small subunit
VTEKGKKATPVSKLSFGEAVGEVEEILAELERDSVDIDHLGERVKRAVELIQVCREKLEKTDGEVRDLVAGIKDDDAEEEDAPF